MEINFGLIEEEKENMNINKIWEFVKEQDKDKRLLVHLIYSILRNKKDRAYEIALFLVRNYKTYQKPIPKQMPISNYLLISNELIDKRIANGYIELDDMDDIRAKILIKELQNEINENKQKYLELFSSWIPKVNINISNKYAPCIENILNRINMGENIGHYDRLVLGIYMINKGVEVEKVIDFYRSLPNFNEKRTRYHLEYIKEKGYKMYSCSRLKQLKLCVAECNISNPLKWKG